MSVVKLPSMTPLTSFDKRAVSRAHSKLTIPMLKLPLLCALALSVCAPSNAQNQTAATLENSGFETPGETLSQTTPGANGFTSTGAIARGWSDNSGWANVGISYALDPNNPHGGQTSQRVEVTRVTDGAAQFVRAERLQKGHIYRFSIWLRGKTGAQMELKYQGASAPYASYGSAIAGLSPEWRQFTVLGRATEDAEVYLMLRATAPLTYWADDASFEDITDAVSRATPNVGNLLSDASFESGIGGGWNARVQGDPAVVWRDESLQSVAGQTPVGSRFGQFVIPGGEAGAISTPLLPVRFGVPHTLSLWMRASQPDTQVSLEMDNSELRSSSKIGTQWTRLTWTFTPPPLDYYRMRLYIASAVGPDRTVDVDGVMLEEGEKASASYLPRAPHEMTLTAPRAGNIYFPSESGTVKIQIAPAPPTGARVALSAMDVQGHVTQLPTQKAGAQLALPFGATQGEWKLRATLQSAQGQALSAPTEWVWTRLPRPKTLPAKAQSYFGLHIPLAPVYIGVARDLGQKFVRLHDSSMIAKWPIAEPEKGRFEFYDQQVDAARAAGLQILGMLDGAPARVSTMPREGGYWGLWNIPDKPGALDEWRTYVSTVAGHYKGRIDDWEVWNEPWGKWWLSSDNPAATPALYAQFMAAAYEAAHRANPNATVLGVDTTSGFDEKWTIPVLAAPGGTTFDVFSYHDYNGTLALGENNRVIELANHMRALQKAGGVAKPMWNTEGGPGEIGSFYAPQTGGLPVGVQASYIVRYDVSSMAAGVKHFFLYAVHSGVAMGDPTYRALEHDDAPRPILAARAVLASLVDGRAAPTQKTLAPGVTCYAFAPAPGEVRGREVDVIWSNDAPQPLAVPRGFEALDIWGNLLSVRTVTVGAEPMYLRALAPSQAK